jgi:hypothetical protein
VRVTGPSRHKSRGPSQELVNRPSDHRGGTMPRPIAGSSLPGLQPVLTDEKSKWTRAMIVGADDAIWDAIDRFRRFLWVGQNRSWTFLWPDKTTCGLHRSASTQVSIGSNDLRKLQRQSSSLPRNSISLKSKSWAKAIRPICASNRIRRSCLLISADKGNR